MQYALGALHGFGWQFAPEDMVEAALLAAAEFSPWVRKPFVTVCVP
jgi:hypothetical protein